MKRLGILIFSVILALNAFSQDSRLKDQHINAVMIKAHYALQIPLLDYAQRYGISNVIGGSLSYKFGKNFILGVDGNFIFGSKFNDVEIYTGVSNKLGQISGWNGIYEAYIVNQRGFTLKGEFGKVFSFGKLNKNSGILASVGFGAMQHKIKLDISESNAPHLNKDMQVGYDRLSNGFLSSQFIGFQYLDIRKRINFLVGWEFNQGYTKNRRTWDYNTNTPSSQALRKDFSTGFKIGWIIPIYLIETDKFYTY